MSSREWDDDEELLAQLDEALREAAEVPEKLLAVARGMYSWRTINDDLQRLTLIDDSHELDNAMVLRSDALRRLLTFAGDEAGIELEVNESSITGQLVPPGPGHVVLSGATGWSDETDADEYGCFRFARPATGAVVRLKCFVRDCTAVTEWITI